MPLELFKIAMGAISLFSSSQDSGALSAYRVNDGRSGEELACGGLFTKEQSHIAYRGWKRVGCGRRVVVCTYDTARCVLTSVRDAGPFGIYRGKLKGAYNDARWSVYTGPRLPTGWRYRAITDLSWELWKRLGRPRGLSRVRLLFLSPGASHVLHFLRHFVWRLTGVAILTT